MKDTDKTKVQVIQELVKMRKKIADLEEIIIEGKQVKTELKEFEKKHKDLVEETLIGIANIGITGKITYINKRLEKISGYSREEVVGKNVFKLGVFPNEMLKLLKERLKVRFRGGSVHQRREIRFKYKDGKWIWIEITAILIEKWGVPSNLRITVQDITERKKAEEELRDSEEHLKTLFDYAPDAYYISDLKGNFIDGNKAAERLMGYKKEELIGKSFLKLKLLSLADIPKAAKLLAKNLRKLPTGPDEFVLNRKDKSKVTVEISTYPVKIKGRALALGIARDITERKQVELELRIERDKLTAIFESMTDGIYIVNKDYDIQYVNPVLKRTFGSPEGKKCYKYFHDSDEPCTFCKNEEVFAGKTVHWEWTSPKYGRTYDLIDTPMKNADGSISKLEIFRNITERKQAEEKEKEHHKNIELLSETAIQFVEFPQDKDIYTFIGEKLQEFTGKNSIIVVNSIDEKTNILTNRTVLGLGKLSEKVVGFLGRHPVGMTFDAKDEILSALSNGKLHLNKEGLYGVFLKTVPKAVCNSLEKLLNIKKIYGVGFTREDKLFGNAVIFLKEDTGELKNKQTIETFIKQASIAIQRRQAEERLRNTLDAAIQTMSKIIEVKDPYTAGHQQRVSQLTTAIAKELNLSPYKVEGIRIASIIHDIGKISVPTEILSKTTTLSDIEFSLIKEHSQAGSDILKAIDFSYPVANIVLQHHEKMNGSGYPNNLKGDKILLEARIICVADVVEAMSSHRPYRPSLGIDAALEEISKNRGVLYDPEIVDVCLKLFKEKGFKFE